MRDQFFGEKTFAQHGDDLMILNIFWLLGIKHPSYLDIGAHHPKNISNTALLYERGSRGVNVEANPNLIDFFHRDRPLDINVNLGVGTENKIMPFYMFDDFSGRNTFSLDEANNFSKQHPQFQIREIKKITVCPIGDIVKECCKGQWPDLLTIDVEGMDHAVISQADFSDEDNRPRVICIEARCGESLGLKQSMADKGYFVYCRMVSNLIFCREADRGKLY